MILTNKRNYKPIENYRPYYEIASAVLEDVLRDTKKALQKKTPNKRVLAELYSFYNSERFKIFSCGECSFEEHLERRGIKMNDVKRMKEAFEEFKLCKKNVKNGWVVRLKSTGAFYIKLRDYICEIDVRNPVRFCELKEKINTNCEAFFNGTGNLMFQKRDENMRNYTTTIVWEQIKNGFYFVIKTLFYDETYTKQGNKCFLVNIKSRILWDTINDDDVEAIFKKGERWDIQ